MSMTFSHCYFDVNSLLARLDYITGGVEISWPDLMRNLKPLHAIRMTLDGTPYLIRTEFGESPITS